MLKDKYDLNELIDIMRHLRSEAGCPWDREQTHDSLKKYLIEETYEVLEAIDLKDKDKLYEELGDLLLQIVFHAQIANENEEFNMEDVISSISRKMIQRHTHVFGDAKADTPDEVVNNWEAIKKKEKGLKTQTGVLKDIPKNLPALMRGYKVQQKAAQVGFDWDDIEDVFKKVDEELQELKEAYKEGNEKNISEELGDLLFSVVNLSRFLKVQPEIALTGTTEKFINRFEFVEKESSKDGKSFKDMNLQEMDRYWNLAKELEDND